MVTFRINPETTPPWKKNAGPVSIQLRCLNLLRDPFVNWYCFLILCFFVILIARVNLHINKWHLFNLVPVQSPFLWIQLGAMCSLRNNEIQNHYPCICKTALRSHVQNRTMNTKLLSTTALAFYIMVLGPFASADDGKWWFNNVIIIQLIHLRKLDIFK